MDTIDMTFDAAAPGHALVELPMTDIQVALAQAANGPFSVAG